MTQEKNFKTFYALSIAWQLGFLVVIPIAGFILLGLLADQFFNTEPLLLIIGVILGILATYLELYHLLKPLMNKKNND